MVGSCDFTELGRAVVCDFVNSVYNLHLKLSYARIFHNLGLWEKV